MRNRRLRQDAVSKIEDERPSGKLLENLVYAAIERIAPRQQHQRIEIALYHNTRRNMLARKFEIHCPIETNRVDCNIIDVAKDSRSNSTRKPDDLGVRNFTAQLCDEALRRLNAP